MINGECLTPISRLLSLALVAIAAGAGCASGARPAGPTEAAPQGAELRWRVTALPAGAPARTCPVLVLRAEEGPDARGELRLRDECEDAPDYRCEESGAGCATAGWQHLGFVDVAGRRFVLVKRWDEWHDNGSVQVHLYGFACGDVKQVWGFSWLSPADETTLIALAPVEPRDWRALEATLRDASGATTRRRLTWSATECRFVQAR